MSNDALNTLTTVEERQSRFGWGWVLVACLVAIWMMAPLVEQRFFPIRINQEIAHVTRFDGFVRFVWISDKLRMAPSERVDVIVKTPDEQFSLTFYNDESPPDAPCTKLVPWTKARTISLGHREQPFCVEIPRAVPSDDWVTIDVTIHYGGFLGLWDQPLRMPPIRFP